ncbi:MAG: hypothetical protein KKB30_08745 [Proteobacteria bacterium]|nr:hypothetical protein [Pseudomonadota bacterium]MBU1716890.1 hypothetical protein [Pseudomonadota bacterium]
MKTQIIKRYYLLALGMIFVLLIPNPAPAVNLNFNGNWNIDEDDNDNFIQSYRQSYSASFEQPVTDLMNVQENIRYSITWIENGATTKNLSPNLSMNLQNYLFDLDLSGSITEIDNSISGYSKSTSWDSYLTSAWKNELAPNLTASFGQNSSGRFQELEQTNAGGTLNWNLILAKIYLSGNWRQIDNTMISNDDEISTNYSARISAAHLFWNNRLNTSFSYQQQNSQSDKDSLITSSGFALLNKPISQIRWSIDDNPESSDGSTFTDVTVAMTNQDLLTPAITLPPAGIDYNIDLKTNLAEVDMIYLYTDVDISVAMPNNFNWQLWSSTDGINFAQETLDANTVIYNTDPINNTYRFEIPVQKQQQIYLKLVLLDYPGAGTINFTEIEAFDQITGTIGTIVPTSSENLQNQTNASLGLQLTETVSLNYNLTMSQTESQPTETSVETRNQSGSIAWRPTTKFKTQINVNDSWRKNTDHTETNIKSYTETNIKSYGLGLNSELLPTLDLGLNGSVNDNYTNNEKTSQNYSFAANITAQLYPDLSSQLRATHTTTKPEDDSKENKQLTTILYFSARLNPQITTSFSGEYTNNQSTTTTDTYKTSINMGWRVSDLLSLAFSGQKTWGESKRETSNLSLVLAITPKIQGSMSYSITHATVNTHSGDVNLRWTVSSNIFMQFIGNYIKNDLQEDIILKSVLTARFSTY